MATPIIRIYTGGRLQAWIRGEENRERQAFGIFQVRGSLLVQAEMRDQVPVGATGELGRQVTRHYTPAGFSVYSTAPHAILVVKGTKPHIIEPKTPGGVLRFYPSATGVLSGRRTSLIGLQAAMLQPVFAKRVHHPGTKPQNYVRWTAEAVRDRLRSLVERIWREVHGKP